MTVKARLLTMTVKARFLHHSEQPALAMPALSFDVLSRKGLLAWRRLVAGAGVRKTRPRLVQLGIPLAITAAAVATLWWALFSLVACAWLCAPRDWGWEWVVVVGRGLIGAEWALVGSYALAAFPAQRAAVAGGWVLAAALLALFSKLAGSRPSAAVVVPSALRA
jgi:hypothetical protein